MLRLAALIVLALLSTASTAPLRAAEDAAGRAASVPWDVPALLVGDLDRSAAWYERELGFERVSERIDGAARSIVLSRGMTFVHLRARAAGPDRGLGPAAAFDEHPRLALLVDDVDALVANLQERGLELLAVPQDDDPGRYRHAVIADPDGNPILLREPLPPGS